MSDRTLPADVLAICSLALLAAGCNYRPVSTSSTENPEVPVAKMFTHNECTVYRFYDGGHDHYYADCKGSTVSPQNCGKGCIRDEEVPTNER